MLSSVRLEIVVPRVVRKTSAGADGMLRLWNGADGTLMRTVVVGSLVYATSLSADGKLAAAAIHRQLTG